MLVNGCHRLMLLVASLDVMRQSQSAWRMRAQSNREFRRCSFSRSAQVHKLLCCCSLCLVRRFMDVCSAKRKGENIRTAANQCSGTSMLNDSQTKTWRSVSWMVLLSPFIQSRSGHTKYLRFCHMSSMMLQTKFSQPSTSLAFRGLHRSRRTPGHRLSRAET
jgi:hypothetical protein